MMYFPQGMTSQLILSLDLYEGLDTQWKDILMESLVDNNGIRKIQICNDHWRNPNFDIDGVIATICQSFINAHLNSFTLILGSISLHTFQKITDFLACKCRFISILNISGTSLGDTSVDLIVAAEWRFIVRLGLSENNITFKGVRTLRKCYWNYIKTVVLSYNPIKNLGVKELIKNNWGKLEELSLRSIELTDDGVKTFGRANWQNLRYLNLSSNQLTYEAVASIRCGKWSNSIKIMFNERSTSDGVKENLQKLRRKENHSIVSFGTKNWED